jgi:hypothetical protein
VVTALADEVFFARLFLSHNGHEIDFDARPSDAVALGVRVACPIFVATDVFDRASVTPEKDESEGDNPDDDRLAVFRDFVNSLNLPDLPDEPDAPERGPSAS